MRPGLRFSGRVLVSFVLLMVVAVLAAPAARADSSPTAPPDSSGSSHTLADLKKSALEGGPQRGQAVTQDQPTSFFLNLTNAPKAGIMTNVTTNKYYGEFNNTLNMKLGSKFTDKLEYSWTDFRQQVKTTEKRGASSSYSTGTTLPFMATVQGNWSWTEDKTTNAAGHNNLSKRDYKTGGLVLSKPKLSVGALNLIMKSSLGANDQKSVNQGQRNDFTESYLDGGLQVGTELLEGVTVAGRLFGRTTGGDRSLGEMTSPSSSTVDTVGIGIYYDQNFTNGRVALTRGNFDRKYLDYKRNANGLIDTVGLDDADKVVDEMEIKDVLTLELVNNTRLLGMNLKTNLQHTMNESDFSVSRVGFKEKLQQTADFTLGFSVGRDSISVGYSYLWKWDDQLTKVAAVKRGRQYNKERDFNFFWGRTLFKATDLTLKYHTGLGQDTAQNGYVNTDKDRLRYDLAIQLKRSWSKKFSTNMLFSVKQSQDLALASTRSANNNIKDSYEIAPGYSWPLVDWLTFSQNFRVYIQYTDYIYSYLPSSTRGDNYNKRGTLSSVVKMKPTSRLELTIKHDYNRRFNADKTNENSLGNNEYFIYQRQKIGKIDLAFVFKVAPGVVLEGATYRTRDEKTTISVVDKVTERLEGKIWLGARVNRKWGKDNPLELSAMVKKYNAYGPSVSVASSDYWESDVWLKWEF